VKHHLIVYAKRPLPGYAKTRLGAVLGTEQSAGVYARLVYTYLLDLLASGLDSIELSLASPEDVPFFAEAFPECQVTAQIDGDLGERMQASFDRAFEDRATHVVLTGSDIPGLSGTLVRRAFDALEAVPLTIGPASDGGYYLIGMRAPGAKLFERIAWSTDRVLAQTEARAHEHDLSIAYLPELDDMDCYEDFVRWSAGKKVCPSRIH
jgi:rSAM/selenodomain-associated transferase 1